LLRVAIVTVWLTVVVLVYKRILLLVDGSKERMYRRSSRYLVIVRGTCLEGTRGLAASWLVTAPQPMRRLEPLRIIT
jgi:hypothetical protein